MRQLLSITAFVERLVDQAVLSDLSGKRLMAAVETTNHPFDAVVTELGLMREDALAKALSDHFACPIVEPSSQVLDEGAVHQFGLDFLKANALVPLRLDGGAMRIALADPFDIAAKSMIDFATGDDIGLAVATRSSIQLALTSLEIEGGKVGNSAEESDYAANDGDLERLKEFSRQEPVVRFVSRILQVASDAKATDIHIEPSEHEVRVRLRIDGDLRIVESAPITFLPGIVTRIKILSGLDISERRLPQDGRMRATIRGQDIDLRVAISPAIYGETIVLRILDRSSIALDLDRLGFENAAQSTLLRLAKTPNGIVLITGPTGSGKTTTLYAMLSALNTETSKIFTVEDPVEYRLDGITQLQTNNATGLTFARALRSILRHDPDVILIGEIRDRETAEIAVQAALTGHLVLATLHTNSALGAVTRLRDMGVDNYLIGATLKASLAQRLVRRHCQCRLREVVDYQCPKCVGSGFNGRTVAYEIAVFDQDASRIINEGSPEPILLKCLEANGFVPFAQHAQHLAEIGVTSHEEALRIGLSGGAA